MDCDLVSFNTFWITNQSVDLFAAGLNKVSEMKLTLKYASLTKSAFLVVLINHNPLPSSKIKSPSVVSIRFPRLNQMPSSKYASLVHIRFPHPNPLITLFIKASQRSSNYLSMTSNIAIPLLGHSSKSFQNPLAKTKLEAITSIIFFSQITTTLQTKQKSSQALATTKQSS